MIRLIVALFMFTAVAAGQNVVPFASRENVIELAVQNTSALVQENVSVRIEQVPSWLSFGSSQQIIERLGEAEERTASFKFSVDKSAPVGKDHVLTFTVSTASGQHWTKEIRISIAAPEKFELLQNYPNPFNPVTTIGYQIAANSRVSLKIYNLIGQEVASVVDEEKTAGYHQESWDASRFSSGMYVYEFVASSGQNTIVSRKAMMLLK